MFEELKMMIEACEYDVYCDIDGSNVYLTFDDFEGFDDDWSEVMRDYVNPEAVEALEDWLDDHCLSCEGDLYIVYHFDGFDVEVGYTSFDI